MRGRDLATLVGAKVKGIVLVSSFLGVPHPMLRLARPLPLHVFPWHWAPAWVLRWLCIGPDASDQLVRQVQEAIQKVPASIISARLKALARLKEPREGIAILCLYLQPTNDRLVPKWHAAKLRPLCYDLTLQVIPGPHLLLQANPEGCIDPVVAFVRSINKSG